MPFSINERLKLATKVLAAGVIDGFEDSVWYETRFPNSFKSLATDVFGTDPVTGFGYVLASPANTLVAARAAAAAGPAVIQDWTSGDQVYGVAAVAGGPGVGTAVRLTPVVGTDDGNGFSTFAAYQIYNDYGSSRLTNWIKPQSVPQPVTGNPSIGYSIALYNGDPNAGGTLIGTSDGQGGTPVEVGWIFNADLGLLFLAEDFRATVQNPFIIGFQYIGDTLATLTSSPSQIIDADLDTFVRVESTPDDDTIRMRVGDNTGNFNTATDMARLSAAGIVLNTLPVAAANTTAGGVTINIGQSRNDVSVTGGAFLVNGGNAQADTAAGFGVGGDLLFNAGIVPATSIGATHIGGAVWFQSGRVDASVGNNFGGNINFVAGGGAFATGGQINITGGAGGTSGPGFDGGPVVITGGSSPLLAGNVNIVGGASANSLGGSITLRSGDSGVAVQSTISILPTVTNSVTTTGILAFLSTGTPEYVGFRAPGVIAANTVWTLPAADGTTGQSLVTNGAGILSWASSSANNRVFADALTVAAVVVAAPTLAEIQAFVTAGTITSTLVFYTGTNTNTDPITHVYWVDAAGVVTLIEEPVVAGRPRVFADALTVAAAIVAEPTLAEITAFTAAGSVVNTLVYYTGTNTNTDPITHVYWVDSLGVVTVLVAPGLAGSPRVFADALTVAAVVVADPTLAEITAFTTAGTITDTLVFYTGTNTNTDPITHVYWVDSVGVVTVLLAPGIAANNRAFADALTVAAVLVTAPTLAEITTFVTTSAITDTLVFYTGTNTNTDPITHVYWVDAAGVVTLLRAPVVSGQPRVFADALTVAAAIVAEPTLAEITTFTTAGSVVNTLVYYTGTNTNTDPITHVYWVDSVGVVTVLVAPGLAGAVREFADALTVAAVLVTAPTLAEITAFTTASGIVNNLVFYTGTNVNTDPITHVYWVDAAGTVTLLQSPVISGSPRVFADAATVAAAVVNAPTVAEITTFATLGSVINTLIYYTGTNINTDPITHVYWVDSLGVVTVLVAPGLAGSVREFADATTVAAAIISAPTVAEIQTFVTTSAITDTLVYYTGTDTNTDPQTFVYWVDAAGIVTLIRTVSSGGGLVQVLDNGVDTTLMAAIDRMNFIGTSIAGNPVAIKLVANIIPGMIDVIIGDELYASNWNANNGTSGDQTVTDSALGIVNTFISSPTTPGVPFEDTLSNAVNRASRTSPWVFSPPGLITGMGPGSTMLVEVLNGAGAVIYSGTAALTAAGAIPAGPNATVTLTGYVIDTLGPESMANVSVSVDIAAILPAGGPARVRLTHTVEPTSSNTVSLTGSPWVYQQPAGPTGLVFFDNGPTPPTLTGAPTIAEVAQTTKFLSGVEYYTTGSTFDMQHTTIGEINNLTSATIANGGAIRINGTEYGLPSLTRSPGGPGSTPLQFTGWNNTFNTTPVQFNEATWGINAVNHRYIGLTGSASMIVADVWNPSASSPTADAAIAVDTFGTTSTDTSEFFDDEARRQDSGFNGGTTPGNWVSSTDLVAGEALVYGGQLMVPNEASYIRSDGPNSLFSGTFTGIAPNPATQPDYALLGTPSNYYRSFVYTGGGSRPSSSMTLAGTPAGASFLADLQSGALEIFVRKIAAATGNFGPVSPPIWLHGANPYNFATFVDGNVQDNDGAGARLVSSTASVINWTFGGFSMQLGVYLHIRINNPAIRINSVVITF